MTEAAFPVSSKLKEGGNGMATVYEELNKLFKNASNTICNSSATTLGMSGIQEILFGFPCLPLFSPTAVLLISLVHAR